MDEMPERLFQWWMDFWQRHPFGPEATNLMLARVCRTIAVECGHRDSSDTEFMPGTRKAED